MSTDDRNLPTTKDAADSEAALPISDLGPAKKEAADGESVKGGGIEITDYGFGSASPSGGSRSVTSK
jgi:hypothetical protein